ncbi:hypothetical protein, partial [Rhodococcus erythropolis]|uniref:hypothetical protein n=1 Tax=Rhodococcus erythropolis TaxID=1833 RepID=UPI001C402F4D
WIERSRFRCWGKCLVGGDTTRGWRAGAIVLGQCSDAKYLEYESSTRGRVVRDERVADRALASGEGGVPPGWGSGVAA